MTTDNNAPADDVVARLRDLEGLLSGAAGKGNFVLAKDAATCRAAASEIERLRAERDERVTDAMRAAAIDAGMQTARKLTALGTSPDYTAMACAQDAIRKLEAALSASPGSSAGEAKPSVDMLHWAASALASVTIAKAIPKVAAEYDFDTAETCLRNLWAALRAAETSAPARPRP